jgi:hypothetical protein
MLEIHADRDGKKLNLVHAHIVVQLYVKLIITIKFKGS